MIDDKRFHEALAKAELAEKDRKLAVRHGLFAVLGFAMVHDMLAKFADLPEGTSAAETRALAEKALREVEQKLSTLFEANPDDAVVWNFSSLAN